VQASQHFLHHRASFVHRICLLGAWTVLVMDRLPSQPAGLGLPVFVANRSPDLFELFQVQALLLGRNLRGSILEQPGRESQK